MDNLFDIFNLFPPSFEDQLEAAEDGDAAAMQWVSQQYLKGDGEVDLDLEKAAYWMEQSAENGFPESAFLMGIFYIKGIGVEKNRDKACEYMNLAKELGDPDAQRYLELFASLDEDEKKAENGDTQALCRLTEFYTSNGNMYPGDDGYEIAFKYAKKAAELEDPEGIWSLALAYEHGRGVEENVDEAIKLFTHAADLGHAKSMHNIGAIYLNEKNDVDKALYWFKKSAENGHNVACCALGSLYEFGEYVDCDYEEAKKWYLMGAERGDAEAQYGLAMIYTGSNDSPTDLDAVVYWLEKSMAGGYEKAKMQYLLWSFLKSKKDKGELPNDVDDLIGWTIEAAENGDEEAQKALGMQ